MNEQKMENVHEIHVVVNIVSAASRSGSLESCAWGSLQVLQLQQMRDSILTMSMNGFLSLCVLQHAFFTSVIIFKYDTIHVVLWLYSVAGEQDFTRTPRP